MHDANEFAHLGSRQRVQRVLDQQCELGVALNDDATIEIEGVGILFARREQSEVTRASCNAEVDDGAAWQRHKPVGTNTKAKAHRPIRQDNLDAASDEQSIDIRRQIAPEGHVEHRRKHGRPRVRQAAAQSAEGSR